MAVTMTILFSDFISFKKLTLYSIALVVMATYLPGAFGLTLTESSTEKINENLENDDFRNVSLTMSNHGNAMNQSEAQHLFMAKASTYTSFKVGNFLQKYYFPVFIPIGVIGKCSPTCLTSSSNLNCSDSDSQVVLQWRSQMKCF